MRSTRSMADKLKRFIYSAGNLRDPPRPIRRSADACPRRTRFWPSADGGLVDT